MAKEQVEGHSENVNYRDHTLTEYVVYHDADGGHLALVTNVKIDKQGNSTYDVFVYDFSKVVKDVAKYEDDKHDNEKFFITSVN
jgi:hypothetical protein